MSKAEELRALINVVKDDGKPIDFPVIWRRDAHATLDATIAEEREQGRRSIDGDFPGATARVADLNKHIGLLEYDQLARIEKHLRETRREAFEEAAEVKFGVREPSEEEKARMRPQDWVDLGVEATRDAIRQLAGVPAPEPRPSRAVPPEIRALAEEEPKHEGEST